MLQIRGLTTDSYFSKSQFSKIIPLMCECECVVCVGGIHKKCSKGKAEATYIC